MAEDNHFSDDAYRLTPLWDFHTAQAHEVFLAPHVVQFLCDHGPRLEGQVPLTLSEKIHLIVLDYIRAGKLDDPRPASYDDHIPF